MNEIKTDRVDQWGPLGRHGLHFLGRATASLTHEIKNGLAVMYEQGNLSREIIALSREGGVPNLERLDQLADRVLSRIKEVDRLVKRINTLSHLADHHRARLDGAAVMGEIVAVYGRLASMKGIALDYPTPHEEVELTTDPLFLSLSLFYLLEAGSMALRSGETLKCSVDHHEKGVMFYVEGNYQEKPITAETITSELLDHLEGRLIFSEKDRRLILDLPRGEAV